MLRKLLLFIALALLACLILTQTPKNANEIVAKLEAAENAPAREGIFKLTESDMKAVILAVEDEIYDHEYCKKYYNIGRCAGNRTDHWVSEVPIYISPSTDKYGYGYAIYKLMPYGEVYRLFFFRKEDGMAVLVGDSENGFPITQPSHLTIYDDDEEICRMKAEWLKRYFLVEEMPPISVYEKAANRQEKRVGFSYWKYNKSKNIDSKK